MRAVLIKGESRYEALRVFMDEIGEALAARGYEVDVIDAQTEPDLHGVLAQAAAGRETSLVFTFSILGDYRDPDGRSLGQVFGAPHVVQYVDYPLTHWVALDRTAPDTALLMIDESHVASVAAIYGAERFAHLGFSPHGAIGQVVAPAADPAAFVRERPIPILFAGSFYEPRPPWWESQAPAIVSIFRRAAELALAHDIVPALGALDAALAEHGIDPTGPDVGEFRKLATHVHEHVRAHRRLQALTVAAELGLPVHVYGRGFEHDRFPGFIYGGEADIGQVTRLMAQSRMVLNINANFGAGSHERPLMALLAGAAAASDVSSFYEAQFEPGVGLATYRWSRLEDDLGQIGRLARDPEALHAMAQAGQAQVAARHRWAHRIDAILAAAEAARARALA
jgi:hypothetical protein